MQMQKKRIYLDYAATTPIDPKVIKVMRLYYGRIFGNPMSTHSFGQEAMKAIDSAREIIAGKLGCSAQEIYFTSGATESNNWAIKGLSRAWYQQKKMGKPHIITSNIEHHCVLDTIKSLEEEGQIEADFIPVNKEGLIKASDIQKAVKDNTLLVSIMYANNEIGTIQPIAEIGKIVAKENNTRSEANRIYFHTDAVQAFGYLSCNVSKINVDLLSISAHKIYGPKGVGALYIKKGTKIAKFFDGGEQERGLRAGTHNVPGIAGLGEATKQLMNKDHLTTIPRIKNLRDYLTRQVLKTIPYSSLNGSKDKRLPNNANFSFQGVEGESIVLALDLKGIAASTGSACTSGALEPSHVLLALGRNHRQAHSSLRITLGKYTTKKEIDYFLKVLPPVIVRLRKIAGR